MSTLDAQLLAAHVADDKPSLVTLYAQAADEAASIDVACFYLTHAYVFALELGHLDISILRARLAQHGRE